MAKRLEKAPRRGAQSSLTTESSPKKPMPWMEASPAFWLRLATLVALLGGLVYFGGRRMQEQNLLQTAKKHIAALEDPAALEVLRQYERTYGKTGEIEFLRARAYRHLSMPERAKEQLDFANQLNFDSQTLDYENMLVDAQMGELDVAEKHFDEILKSGKVDASEVIAAFCYGNLIKMQFRKVGALVAAWMQSEPDNGMPYTFLGMLAQYNQDWKSARTAFEEAQKRSPNLPTAIFGEAETLLKLDEFDKAVPLYRKYLETRSDNFDAQRGLAEALLGSNQSEEALKMLEMFIANGERSFDIRMLLGRTQFDLGKVDEAIKTLAPLRELWPDDIDLNYTLARAYSQNGQDALADPLFAKTEEGRAIMKDFDIRMRQASQEPENAQLRFELGRLLMNYSSREEGRVWLQGAIQLKPDLIPALQEMEKYYSKKGDTPNAVSFRQALQRLGVAPEKKQPSEPPKANDTPPQTLQGQTGKTPPETKP